MNLRTLFDRSALGAVLLATICSSTAALADDKPKVPFKAAFSIVEPTIGSDGLCARITMISGTGTATHLGRATLMSQDCVTITSFDPLIFGFASNNVALQAANGDQLFAKYSGSATPQLGGTLSFVGTFSFTGGTGRFIGATGGGSLEGLEDISVNPARGVAMMSGRISY